MFLSVFKQVLRMIWLRPDIEHKTVEQGHLSLNLTIVRPIGVKEKAPAFPVLPRRRFHVGGLPDA